MPQKVYLFLVLSLFCSAAQAQDAIFSQFHRSNIYLNPAFTGIDGGISATVVNREQWGRINGNTPIPGAFRTQFISVDWTKSQLNSGLSLFFMNDNEGDANLRTEYGGLNYCYVLPVEKWHGLHNFRIGFGVHYSKKSIDWDQLLFSDQLHEKGEDYFLSASNHAQFYDDFRENSPFWTGVNLGFVYRYSQEQTVGKGREISAGLSATHALNLFSPTSFESLQQLGTGVGRLFVLHSSAYFPGLVMGTKGNRFTPIFNGRIQYQGGISAFTLGGDLLYQNFGLGIYYQNSLANTIINSTDALIIGYNMEIPFGNRGQSVELGLSYDFNLNGLGSHSGGVMELVLKYRMTNVSDCTNCRMCPPVSRAHRLKWENIWYRNAEKKN